jgi:hypothetical protein
MTGLIGDGKRHKALQSLLPASWAAKRLMSGGDRFFAETNLLLYLMDTSAPKKRGAALLWLEALWAHRAGVLGWQENLPAGNQWK